MRFSFYDMYLILKNLDLLDFASMTDYGNDLEQQGFHLISLPNYFFPNNKVNLVQENVSMFAKKHQQLLTNSQVPLY